MQTLLHVPVCIYTPVYIPSKSSLTNFYSRERPNAPLVLHEENTTLLPTLWCVLWAMLRNLPRAMPRKHVVKLESYKLL
jgi:hypothetical protein